MAHTCPDCGQLCMCNGDIDDICFGDVAWCIHYRDCDYDDDDWYGDFEDEYDYCDCKYCNCFNRTEHGITCPNCLSGAHQG